MILMQYSLYLGSLEANSEYLRGMPGTEYDFFTFFQETVSYTASA